MIDNLINELLIEEQVKAMKEDKDYKVNLGSLGLLTKKQLDDFFDEANRLVGIQTDIMNSLYNECEFIEVSSKSLSEYKISSTKDNIKEIDIQDSNNIFYINGKYSLSQRTVRKSGDKPSKIQVFSNGFIGDTKRGYIKDGEYAFVGENSPKCSLMGLVTDNLCTFEYLSSNDIDLYKTAIYEEGISYIDNEKRLDVTIDLSFDSSTSSYNVISFKDISAPFIIKNIKIIAADGNIYTTKHSYISNKNNVINIKRCVPKKIIISLSQNTPIASSVIVPIDDNVGSIVSTGMSVKNGDIVFPVFTGEDTANPKELFSKNYKKTLENVNRYSIDIGEIKLSEIEYETEGTIIQKIYSAEAIKDIRLFSIEDLEKEHESKYEISIDGINFHEITPFDRANGNDISSIIISKVTNPTGSNELNLISLMDAKSFILKTSLKTKDIYSTPTINEVMVDINGIGGF